MHQRAINRFNLENRVIWVVGGAGLLGSAVSRALAEHGAHVVVADLRSDDAAKLAEAIRADGLLASPQSIDAADEQSIIRCCKQVVDENGKIDACVNMTFRYTKTPWMEMTTTEWEHGMRVSLTGAFLVGKEAAKAMLSRGKGSIVHFSSMYGVVSPDPAMYPAHVIPNPIDYGVSKAGVLQMVRYHAVAMARQGVRVNAIVPGPFPYPWSQQKDDEFMNRLAGKVPMGRVGHADEIAGAVVYLCSDASSFVTGTQVTIDGGWTAW